MTWVTLFLAVVTLLAGRQVYEFWRRMRGHQAASRPRRLPADKLASIAIVQVALTAWLIATYGHLWTFASVGLRPLIPFDGYMILAGELGFLAVILVNLVVLKLTRAFTRLYREGNRANLSIWPREGWAKWLAGILIMGFNPFTEELVMRGILIHQWGELLGSPVVPIIVGALLNGALHLYQGWRLQLWHALFFTMAVALLYSPWGLGAAITAHVFGDVLPIVTLRRNQRRLRSRCRNERMIRAT
jgi:membrane protease YdiL (CAAX protease family)